MQAVKIETEEITSATRMGTIVAIAYSPELINGVGKEVQSSADVTTWGIPGDRHYGETRYSFRKHQQVPNLRPITVLGVEAVREACEALEIPAETVPYGGMGENFLTEGLGNLSELREGDQMQVLDESGEPKVILHVRDQNDPCSNLQFYHKQMTKQMMHKRGLLCTVLKEGRVDVGDRVIVVKA